MLGNEVVRIAVLSCIGTVLSTNLQCHCWSQQNSCVDIAERQKERERGRRRERERERVRERERERERERSCLLNEDITRKEQVPEIRKL